MNVRAGPGTSYSVVKVLKKNAQVNTIKKTGNWYQIGQKQFVSGAYLGSCSGNNGGVSIVPPSSSGDKRKCPSFWNKYSKTRYPTRDEYVTALKSLVGKNIIYTQKANKGGKDRWSGINKSICPSSVPPYADCSSFTTWFYWTAFGGLKDSINNQSWSAGYTGTMGNGKKVSYSSCQKGDYILYKGHATTFVGNNQVVTYGATEGKTTPVRLVSKGYRSDYVGCYSVPLPFGQKF